MAEILEDNTFKRQTILRIMLWLAMTLFAGHASTHMVAAGDTWVALACGRHFINHGVDTVEPFSYNSHHAGPSQAELDKYPQWTHGLIKKWHPTGWINQNWLTHVIFYKLTMMFGSELEPNYNMLVAWKFAIYLIAMACIYFAGRLIGASGFSSALMCCISLFVSRTFLDIRPAGFSNVLVPIWILILLLTVYKSRHYIWLSIPLAIFWANVHGGYLYMFVVLAIFFVINFVANYFKIDSIPHLDKTGLLSTFFSGCAAFIAMIVFNPYHLTNLTHTFIISASENAEDWRKVNEWHGAFEIANPVGKSIPFLILFFVFGAVAIIWFLSWISNPIKRNLAKPQKNRLPAQEGVSWPKIELSLIAIVVFTMFMAVKSRRFIPIASFVAAPLMGLWLDQILSMFSIRIVAMKISQFKKPQISSNALRVMFVICASVVIVFGLIFSLQFKRVYLDPFPLSIKYDSIFMRMTASYLKPFDACGFIRDNNLSGHMINYWTEGGFVALSQNPDEQTGEIPLKLFMDGRAQAAYDIGVFNTYNKDVLMGGSVGRALRGKFMRRKPHHYTSAEKKQLIAWYRPLLEKYNAWLVLMPKDYSNSSLMQAVDAMGDWRMVFFNDRQKIMVNTSCPQGRELFEGIFTGKTVYANEYDRSQIEALYMLMSKRPVAQIIDKLASAHKQSVSLGSLNIIRGLRGEEAEVLKRAFFEKLLQEFTQSADNLKSESGYSYHLVSALISADYLGRKAGFEDRKKYKAILERLKAEKEEVLKNNTW